MEEITSLRGDYQFLSNFTYSPFVTTYYRIPKAARFRTVEHYFQASKAQLHGQAFKITKAKSPRHAKTMGRMCMPWDDWEEIKQDVMLTGLRHKFAIPSFQEKLIATGDAILIEGNRWNDRYWGMVQLNGAAGPVWVGENHLGKLLMQVRKELQENEND